MDFEELKLAALCMDAINHRSCKALSRCLADFCFRSNTKLEPHFIEFLFNKIEGVPEVE